jgi:hypothetical protein
MRSENFSVGDTVKYYRLHCGNSYICFLSREAERNGGWLEVKIKHRINEFKKFDLLYMDRLYVTRTVLTEKTNKLLM